MNLYLDLSLSLLFLHNVDSTSRISNFRSELPLKLHEWHTVRVSRTARLAFLSVDSQETQSQLSAGAFDELTADQVHITIHIILYNQ